MLVGARLIVAHQEEYHAGPEFCFVFSVFVFSVFVFVLFGQLVVAKKQTKIHQFTYWKEEKKVIVLYMHSWRQANTVINLGRMTNTVAAQCPRRAGKGGRVFVPRLW